jgi:hypothetical protein
MAVQERELVLDRDAMERTLPYDDPRAIYVDEVRIAARDQAIGSRRITEDDCRGHFGIVPGYLLQEMAHQVGACLLLSQNQYQDCVTMVTSGQYEIFSRATVDETVVISTTLDGALRKRGFQGDARGTIHLGSPTGIEVMRLQFSFRLMPRDVFARLNRSKTT